MGWNKENNTWTVDEGNTLSHISRETGISIDNLVKWNNIANRNLIYIGQVIKLTNTGSSSSSSSSNNSNKATINAFGLQSDTETTLFATWKWDKENTDHYQVIWYYDTGDSVWFIGSDSTVKDKQCTYNFPSNAKKVKFKVKPISKTHTVNNKETSYWTADFSTEKIYDVLKESPPAPPSAPNVVIENVTLTASLDNIDEKTTTIEFQIVKDDGPIFKTAKTSVKTRHASYSCTVTIGCEYKVRCRAVKGNLYSDWSEYSNNEKTKPVAPAKFPTCRAESETSVYLGWSEVKTATGYEIQYTTEKKYFDESDQVQSVTTTGKGSNHRYINSLASGDEYFFRVRATNDKGESDWTPIKSCVIGKKPAAPTTWSSTETAVVRTPIHLYWVHNAQDDSSMKKAQIELYVNGVSETVLIQNYYVVSYESGKYIRTEEVFNPTSETRNIVDNAFTTTNEVVYYNTSSNGTRTYYCIKSDDPDEENRTRSYTIITDNYRNDTVIEWRVRTQGILNEWGEWSTQRTINVYMPVEMTIEMFDKEGNSLPMVDKDDVSFGVVESFPLYVKCIAEPPTQTPIGYYLTVSSNDTYETVDNAGNTKIISAGEQVYSKNFDITSELMVELSANNIDLENNIDYVLTCTVSMSSGLTAAAETNFTVAWTEVEYTPNVEISIDEETLVAHIHPYCYRYENVYSHVFPELSPSNKEYHAGQVIKSDIWEPKLVEDTYTVSGYPIYTGRTDEGDGPKDVTYCVNQRFEPIEGVTLAVYRREFDGSFTEIASGLRNTMGIFVTDPHPSLDFARYRIVAIDDATGAVSYYDPPGYPVGGKAIVIQWDEEWSSFDAYSTDPNGNPIYVEDPLAEPSWGGSMLKLPYNVDVSSNYSPDVSLIEYAGRKHPVSYYGTHTGESASWSTTIPKSDKETLYGLRRLANWMGDVYVREPSGSGYWAKITVGFSQKHLDLTIPITLDITRVEGGM